MDNCVRHSELLRLVKALTNSTQIQSDTARGIGHHLRSAKISQLPLRQEIYFSNRPQASHLSVQPKERNSSHGSQSPSQMGIDSESVRVQH